MDISGKKAYKHTIWHTWEALFSEIFLEMSNEIHYIKNNILLCILVLHRYCGNMFRDRVCGCFIQNVLSG
jgi:cytochrome b subunit of formate dehydrogenase